MYKVVCVCACVCVVRIYFFSSLYELFFTRLRPIWGSLLLHYISVQVITFVLLFFFLVCPRQLEIYSAKLYLLFFNDISVPFYQFVSVYFIISHPILFLSSISFLLEVDAWIVPHSFWRNDKYVLPLLRFYFEISIIWLI